MATCFRIPNRLCCSTFFKPTYLHHAAKSTSSSSKSLQRLPSKADINALNTGQIYRISATSQLRSFNDSIERKSDDCMRYFPLIASTSELDGNCRTHCRLSLSEQASNQYRLISSSSPNKSTGKEEPQSNGRPSEEQLQLIFEHLSAFLPRLFADIIDADKYHKNVVLENRIRGKRTVGIRKYSSQVALLKMVAHFKFAYVKFHVLKITKHPEDGTIKCRWRIVGIDGMSVIFQFWKFRPSTMKDKINNAPTWYDGFSTFVVGSDGLIHKHIIDKMMPDDDKVTVNKTVAPKVALCLGILPPGQQPVLSSIINSSRDHSSYLSEVMLPLEKISTLP